MEVVRIQLYWCPPGCRRLKSDRISHLAPTGLQKLCAGDGSSYTRQMEVVSYARTSYPHSRYGTHRGMIA
jgi:hypothetical protein